MSDGELGLTLLAFGAFLCIAVIAGATLTLHHLAMGHGMSGPAPVMPYIQPSPPCQPVCAGCGNFLAIDPNAKGLTIVPCHFCRGDAP